MRGLEAAGPRPTATPGCGCVKPALETGNILTEPIGYLESCFSVKNGTPRQPSICSHSRACLRIRKSIFNNPEHSLMGLEQFSHVWILFVFHKNGHLSCKAKVQPPRLDGAKTGVFSTRSPHRPNAIGLTLARLEKVEDGAVYLSGIDMIHGTPVLDIKPYIADYDSPQSCPTAPLGSTSPPKRQPHLETVPCSEGRLSALSGLWPHDGPEGRPQYPEDGAAGEKGGKPNETACAPQPSPPSWEVAAELGSESGHDWGPSVSAEPAVEQPASEEGSDGQGTGSWAPVGIRAEMAPREPTGAAPCSAVPAWVREAPVAPLQVRFTPHAEMQLRDLGSAGGGPSPFRYLQSAAEARQAIEAVLAADPRSVYRRKLCQDRLFYFTVDTVHITCWFGNNFAEVLWIQPASGPGGVTGPGEAAEATVP
ncbi:tRNA (adenine(37)-N6)-methyltransferase [Sorex fumeus]|uniref:tRNA (adenine(37)-N6)-methyltransferase n=1 Tax=Sorex fumeus TaxID=62283 RepID=UPI0024AD9C6E|nr:tRNA (adenine(37)-N6)-methyltransferase [Sorex fumeus]